VVFHPDAGSDDADKLALLASAGLPTAGRRPATPAPAEAG
jgi:hypothetical protein